MNEAKIRDIVDAVELADLRTISSALLRIAEDDNAVRGRMGSQFGEDQLLQRITALRAAAAVLRCGDGTVQALRPRIR